MQRTPTDSTDTNDGIDWTYGAETLNNEPTAVAVSSFTAHVSDDAVAVQWETASEADIAGFNVRRSRDGGTSYVTLNPSLIPAQASGSPIGSRYEFRDAALPGAGRYWYVLEAVTLDGSTEHIGPVRVWVKTVTVPPDLFHSP